MLHLSRHVSTHVNLLFSQHLYVRKGPSVSDEFLLEEHFEREMQLKKFTTRRKLALFFFSPLSRATFTSGYSERERSLGLRATDHSQLHPLHEMHSHTHTYMYTEPSRRTLHQREHAKFPHRRDKRIFAIGCSNPVGPPSATCEAHSRKLTRKKKRMPQVKETPWNTIQST